MTSPSQPERRWPRVVLSRPTPVSDPENFLVYHAENGPDGFHAETYVPESTLEREKAEREAVEDSRDGWERRYQAMKDERAKLVGDLNLANSARTSLEAALTDEPNREEPQK
jgi:hypothetical protein